MRARLPGFGATAPPGGRPWRVSPLPRQPSSPRPGAGKKHQRLKLVVFWKYDLLKEDLWKNSKPWFSNVGHRKPPIIGFVEGNSLCTGDPVFYHLVGWWGHVNCSFHPIMGRWASETAQNYWKVNLDHGWKRRFTWNILKLATRSGLERRCGKIKN